MYSIKNTTFDVVTYEYYYGNLDEIAKIPKFMGSAMQAMDMIPTAVKGPFVFYNGFENSKYAEKLLKLTCTLYPVDKNRQEADKLIAKYEPWITVIPYMIAWLDQLKLDATKQWTNVERVRIANS